MVLAFVLLLVGATACRTSVEPSTTSGTVDSWQDDFHIWPNRENIPVCWVNPEDGDPEYMAETEDVVGREYARAGIAFKGWKKCADERHPDGLRVTILPEKIFKNQASIGTNDDEARMDLSQGFSDAKVLATTKVYDPKTGAQKPVCQSQRGINCIRGFALHEFGHAAGLRHERERVENNCDLGGVPVDHEEHWKTATQIGDFDDNSIMNYCKNNLDMIADVVPKLSDLDVATLKALYEMPIAKIAGDLAKTSEGLYRLNLKVVGPRAMVYRYKYGVAGVLDCKTEDGYAGPFQVGRPITDSLSQAMIGKRVKVCVLGGNASGWQQSGVYSSVSYMLR
ncbi:MAG: hypothetical protein AB7T49_04945 [Oligoflexales bacterium]